MRERENQEGYLRLEVEPESAQVFVDGLYAGTVSDFRRSGGGTLDAGPHRIEFRAEGYDSQSVELRIRANDVLSYRGTLTRRDERPELRAAAGPTEDVLRDSALLRGNVTAARGTAAGGVQREGRARGSAGHRAGRPGCPFCSLERVILRRASPLLRRKTQRPAELDPR